MCIRDRVYPYANANPFFPSVGGTHKPIANTSDGITGTQPGGLDANAVYAGAYSEYSKGAVEPTGDYRFAIQNDQKWIYASPSGIAWNTPNAADQKDIMFSSTATATSIAAVASKAGITGGSAASVVTSGIGPNNAGSCNSGTGPSSPANNKKTFTVGNLTIGGTAYSSIMRVLEQDCVEVSGTCSVSAGNASQSVCEGAPHNGTWTPSYGWSSGTDSEVVCAYNRVQQWLTATGGTSGTTTGCLLYTSPSPRDATRSRMPSSA
mgnify:CR=1 FL=1